MGQVSLLIGGEARGYAPYHFGLLLNNRLPEASVAGPPPQAWKSPERRLDVWWVFR